MHKSTLDVPREIKGLRGAVQWPAHLSNMLSAHHTVTVMALAGALPRAWLAAGLRRRNFAQRPLRDPQGPVASRARDMMAWEGATSWQRETRREPSTTAALWKRLRLAPGAHLRPRAGLEAWQHSVSAFHRSLRCARGIQRRATIFVLARLHRQAAREKAPRRDTWPAKGLRSHTLRSWTSPRPRQVRQQAALQHEFAAARGLQPAPRDWNQVPPRSAGPATRRLEVSAPGLPVSAPTRRWDGGRTTPPASSPFQRMNLLPAQRWCTHPSRLLPEGT